jgi:hypothetical protein
VNTIGCSEKRRYASKRDAKRAVKSMQSLFVGSETAGRIYRCRNCGGWHATAQESRPRAQPAGPVASVAAEGPRSALTGRYVALRETGVSAGDAARALAGDFDLDVGTVARQLVRADSRLMVEVGALIPRNVARRREQSENNER